MIDLSGFTPFVVVFLVFGTVTAGLAAATLVQLAREVRKAPARPVVLVTSERTTDVRAAA